VLSWGDNSFGQLGDGMSDNTDLPVQVAVPAGNKVTAIGIGGGPCAITSFAVVHRT
jgi:hypothetical protein